MAIRRLIDPPEVEGGLVLSVALLGIVVNLLATWILSRANRERLNVEGAFQHVLTDLFAFVATAVAGPSSTSPTATTARTPSPR